ncbi:MAG TPA: L,D-transpeptidase [Methylocystis sp.]|nr:L,D-transpeptidase [Methylocystis sp.]
MVGAAQATTRIHIDLSAQTMHVESSRGSYTWAVSTARSGYSTPRGSYAPTGMQRMHYSKKYHNSPMPYSIFFRGGYAIHGTYETGALGRPASHGCVRLSPEHAAMLYQMVQAEGGSISISGAPPGSTRFASRRHNRGTMFASRHTYGEALGYAETYRHGGATVRSWQRNPAASPFSSFFGF